MKAKTGAVIIGLALRARWAAAWLSLLGLTWWMLLDGRIHPLAALITFVVVAAGAGAIAAEEKTKHERQ